MLWISRRPAVESIDDGVLHVQSPISHACYLVQPSNRGEYEINEAIDLLIQSGRVIYAIGIEGWRIEVRYPEDRGKAEQRLSDEKEDTETNP